MKNSDLILRAKVFATAAHAAVGQKRKYTGEDYINHPAGVVAILRDLNIYATKEMIAAAWLHDVIEDTKVNERQIYSEFGETVAGYVVGLSKVSTEYDGNRQVRKEKDRLFLSKQCPAVQTIKCADLIHNTSSIVDHDRAFAKLYLGEMVALLDSMEKASDGIRCFAYVVAETNINKLEN